jgi:hypothetical protein
VAGLTMLCTSEKGFGLLIVIVKNVNLLITFSKTFNFFILKSPLPVSRNKPVFKYYFVKAR